MSLLSRDRRLTAIVVGTAACVSLIAGCTSDGPAGAGSASASASRSGVANSAGPASSSSVSIAPPASTPVQPPNSGNISETVPPVSVETKPAVPLDKPVAYGDGVTAKIVGIVPTTASAKVPGEVSGPAIRLTVKLTNGSKTAIDISNVVVNLYDQTGAAAGLITSGGDKPFSGSLKPAGTADGIYLFTVATTKRKPVTVNVIYQGAKPVGVWKGNVG